MNHEVIAAYVGVGIGIVGIVFSFLSNAKAAAADARATDANALASKANQIALESNRLNVDFFRRQGVIDLHMAWRAVNELNTDKLIGPDVNLAANALDLTASLWNHDVMEKEILYQSYWDSYRLLFETLKGCDKLVPGYKKKACDFITSAVELAYERMKAHHLAKTTTTKLT